MGREIVLKGNDTCEKGMPVVVSCVPGRTFAPSVSAGYRKAYRVEVSPVVKAWLVQFLLLYCGLHVAVLHHFICVIGI